MWHCIMQKIRNSTKCFNFTCSTMLLPLPKKEVMFLVRSVCLSVCLSVCPSDYSQTCERILTKFFVGVGHGSRTKWYNFGGDPDHALDPGVQSPKSGSSGLPCSAEVCALWAYLVKFETDINPVAHHVISRTFKSHNDFCDFQRRQKLMEKLQDFKGNSWPWEPCRYP